MNSWKSLMLQNRLQEEWNYICGGQITQNIPTSLGEQMHDWNAWLKWKKRKRGKKTKELYAVKTGTENYLLSQSKHVQEALPLSPREQETIATRCSGSGQLQALVTWGDSAPHGTMSCDINSNSSCCDLSLEALLPAVVIVPAVFLW